MEQVSTWQGAGGAGRERGAVTIMFALMVAVLIGFLGMALDLAQIYNRRAELQTIAAGAALAAARQLNGTAAGVTAALQRASATAGALKYQYNQRSVSWNNAAIAFSATASGNWVDAANAQAAPTGLLYAKVDTSALDADVGAVSLAFMRALSSAFASTSVNATAIAGRSAIRVAPLALCAMSSTAAAQRVNPPATVELVEFGFRRGVSYDLMQLNPNASTAVNFVIDPLDPPGSVGTDANTWPATVSPFACTGTLAMARVTGGAITVAGPFPLDSLYKQLNSRFDQYTDDLCSPNGAPPDSNVKSYAYNNAIPWMNTAPGQQSALAVIDPARLWTRADPSPAMSGTTAANYGPLWAYARAVPWASYAASPTEPANGYTPFNTSNWSTLYKPGQPSANATYPGGVSTPYRQLAGANFLAPSATHQPGQANRRVLNVALLNCPVAGAGVTTATVLGIGRFFMMVPATPTSLYAEFAGAVPEQSLAGAAELIQ
ncbi:MAG TPA: pilus assembly protein TadG-related protein [Burkholderiaceae bacterium]|nr:pilus assembly protein TadG-related protein [Burkholderiaceae bacterium]